MPQPLQRTAVQKRNTGDENMNKKHDQTEQKNDHAKPNTFVVDGDGAWLVANGYQHPTNSLTTTPT